MKPYSIFFLQRNGTYFLNKPRTNEVEQVVDVSSDTLDHCAK